MEECSGLNCEDCEKGKINCFICRGASHSIKKEYPYVCVSCSLSYGKSSRWLRGCKASGCDIVFTPIYIVERSK